MMAPPEFDTSAPAGPAPEVSSPAPATPAPESAPASPVTPDTSGDPVTQAQPPVAKPTPELSLREKIQKKADEVAARHQKDPVTGKFLAKKPSESPAVIEPKTGEKPLETGQKPVVPASETPPAAFTPNYSLEIMQEKKEIPELLRPLMKDEASSKQIREIMEKAYGLDYVKPKLEQARTQLTGVSQELGSYKGQIANAVQLFNRGDIDGWLKALAVPEERILQWVADKLEYSRLPAEQKAVLDARKQAETRAFTAEQQMAQFQQQHEQNLTQQVQTALESCLARPDVDSVAKAYDTRTGKPGSFKAEVNRRGDYIWRTQNKVAPPEQLVQELMQVIGPVAPPAASTQAPAASVAPPTQRQATPVIPNISGRSTSALPTSVKSIADLRAKHKELQARRS